MGAFTKKGFIYIFVVAGDKMILRLVFVIKMLLCSNRSQSARYSKKVQGKSISERSDIVVSNISPFFTTEGSKSWQWVLKTNRHRLSKGMIYFLDLYRILYCWG